MCAMSSLIVDVSGHSSCRLLILCNMPNMVSYTFVILLPSELCRLTSHADARPKRRFGSAELHDVEKIFKGAPHDLLTLFIAEPVPIRIPGEHRLYDHRKYSVYDFL